MENSTIHSLGNSRSWARECGYETGDSLIHGGPRHPRQAQDKELLDKKNPTVDEYAMIEEILDSVTLYLHLTTEDIGATLHTRLTITNIPFTDPDWKKNQYHVSLGSELPVLMDVNAHANKSYQVHRKLMFEFAYLLTIRGHEVFTCTSRNPSDVNGKYDHTSDMIKANRSDKREKEVTDASNLG